MNRRRTASSPAGPRRRPARRHRWLVCALLPVFLFVTACTEPGAGPDAGSAAPSETVGPSPFADCAALSAPPIGTADGSVSGSPDGARRPSAETGQPMPAVDLPCFTGGATVALGDLRGPAVINIWASSCAPCRDELPAFQRLAERTEGRLHVVGVNTRDRRSAAQSLAEDFEFSFPTLFDPEERLRVKLARPFLPITLFVDGEGRIRYVDESGALDDETLIDLVRQQLGVVAPS